MITFSTKHSISHLEPSDILDPLAILIVNSMLICFIRNTVIEETITRNKEKFFGICLVEKLFEMLSKNGTSTKIYSIQYIGKYS